MPTKITLTIESDNPNFVERVMRSLQRDEIKVVVPVTEPKIQLDIEPAAAPAGPAATPVAQTAPDTGAPATAAAPVEKTRRKRSDAGQPRGPYKTEGAAQAVAPAGTTPAATGAPSATGETATPPAATQSAGSSPAGASTTDEYLVGIEKKNAAARASVQTAAAPAKKLTHDDIRAHLAQLNKIPGLGMPACQDFIQSYRTLDGREVKRISDVPEAEFPRWFEMVDARIAAFRATGK